LSVKSRQRARTLLLQALYQWQLSGHDYAELLDQYSSLAEFERADQAFFRDILRTVLDDVTALDALIASFAVRKLDQLDAVGRAALLIALAELKFRDDVPTKVAINEGVELAKRFGAADSFRFVNAVLDKASKELRRQDGRLTG
jgi:transcription antitermination protein NusB